VYSRIVIREFADAATEAVFYDEPTTAVRRLPKILWPVIRRRLEALHAATSLDDLRVPPDYRLERLRGDQTGRYSIRVNDRYRVTFRFERGHAWEVRCEDYH
jgi:toxin HigB-1